MYQLIQHSFVWLYHDDYGYLTLNYGVDAATVGMNYGLGDILQYLHWHYRNWGGRVLFFFFLIVTARIGGLMLLRVVQSVIMTGIFYGMYLLVRGKQKDSIPLAITTVLLWGTFSIDVVRDGVYWFTASVLYTWPMLFLLLGILIHREIISVPNKIVKNMVQFLLFFIAGFSQEQMAVLTISYIGLTVIFELIHKKTPNWNALCGAVCGGAVEILAPGNFVRAGNQDNAAFAELSLLEKIQKNFFSILSMNVGAVNFLFVLVICCTVLLGAVSLWKENKNKFGIIFIAVLDCLYPLLLVSVYLFGIGGTLLYPVMLIWTVNALILLIWFGMHNKNTLLICLLGGGFCSQAMMVVSPALSYRSMIMFQYVMTIVALTVWYDFIKNADKGKCIRLLYGSGYCLFTVVCIVNIAHISYGYYRNNRINEENAKHLWEVSERIKQGEEITKVSYYKVPNTKYNNDMPYMESKDYIQYWLRDYYELPQNVELVYEWLAE